jgi:hypothetical protein
MNPSTVEVEVHRSGYVSAIVRLRDKESSLGLNCFVVHPLFCEIFRAMASILAGAWRLTSTDVPYLLSCSMFNAGGVIFWYGNSARRTTDPFEERELVWPEHFRATGQDPAEIAEEFCLELYNGFGLPSIIA